ncbi:MAG TPA: hypothetical protein VF711_13435 [Acidimicrobiales bacterium]
MAGRLIVAAPCGANDAACGIAPEASIAAAVVCFGLGLWFVFGDNFLITAKGIGAFLLLAGVFCLAQIGDNL